MAIDSRLDRLDKNYLINGGFDYYQRAGAVTPVNTTTSSTYSGPDRWRVLHAGTFTGTPNIVRSTVIPNARAPYSNRWEFRRNASAATLSYEQRIEAQNCYELFESGKMSLSFFINSTVAPSGTQVNVILSSANAVDNFSTQTVQFTSFALVPVANTWQQIKFENISTFAAMLNGMSVRIEFSYPSGTDASVQNAYLTQVMLNANAAASNFERFAPSIDSELVACQRFYEKTFPLDSVPVQNFGTSGSPVWATGQVTNIRFSTMWHFKATKRVSPNLTTFSTNAASANWSTNTTIPIVNVPQLGQYAAIIAGGIAVTPGNDYAIHATADAEL